MYLIIINLINVSIAVMQNDLAISIQDNLVILSPTAPQRYGTDFLSRGKGGAFSLFTYARKNQTIMWYYLYSC